MGTSRSEFTTVHCKWASVHLYVSRASDLFLQCKSSTFLTLELVHWVGGFTVSKDGERISEVGVRAVQ